MEKLLAFGFLFLISVNISSCGSKKNRDSNNDNTSSNSVEKDTASTASNDTIISDKFTATPFKVDTNEVAPQPGFNAPPARAGKEARKAWDNIFRECGHFSELSKYDVFLGVGSVQAVGQEMVVTEDGWESGSSLDIKWFLPDTAKARTDIFPMGESNGDNVIECSGETGKKIQLNTLLGGNINIPSNMDTKLKAELKAALDRKVKQVMSVKWKRKEINILMLPAYLEEASKEGRTPKIYYENLFKDDIVILTKGIVVESFRTKITLEGMTQAELGSAFRRGSTLNLNADFKLKVENNKEVYLESNKSFVIRGSFYQFKQRNT